MVETALCWICVPPGLDVWIGLSDVFCAMTFFRAYFFMERVWGLSFFGARRTARRRARSKKRSLVGLALPI